MAFIHSCLHACIHLSSELPENSLRGHLPGFRLVLCSAGLVVNPDPSLFSQIFQRSEIDGPLMIAQIINYRKTLVSLKDVTAAM